MTYRQVLEKLLDPLEPLPTGLGRREKELLTKMLELIKDAEMIYLDREVPALEEEKVEKEY